MATTYGYGGEFSSDEDMDKLERQAEQRASKFDSFTPIKPNRQQIEEAIKTIKNKPVDEEVHLADELLVALLDFYKIQRGPVVDSTRTLYKKLVLRQIRNDMQVNNGELNNKDNINGNNNNTTNFKLIENRAGGDVASSDDDEPMPPASSQSSVDMVNRKNFDARVVYNDKLEPMEVDSEITPQQMAIREGKPIDMPTSSESETDDSDSESSSLTGDSEVVDITPPKKDTTEKVVQSTASQDAPPADLVPKQPRVSVRKEKVSVATTETKSKSNEEEVAKKKPYTRSQRMAATRAATKSTDSKTKKTDVSSSKVDEAVVEQVKPLSKSMLTSFNNCTRSLSKIKLDTPIKMNLMQDENGVIDFHGTSINGRKLNYAEKIVLTNMVKRKQALKPWKVNQEKSTSTNKITT